MFLTSLFGGIFGMLSAFIIHFVFIARCREQLDIEEHNDAIIKKDEGRKKYRAEKKGKKNVG